MKMIILCYNDGKACGLFIDNDLAEKQTQIFEKWGNYFHYLGVEKDAFIT